MKELDTENANGIADDDDLLMKEVIGEDSDLFFLDAYLRDILQKRQRGLIFDGGESRPKGRLMFFSLPADASPRTFTAAALFAPLFFPYFRRNACAPASPARRFGTSPRNRRSGTSEKSGSGRPPRRSRRTSPLTAPTAVRSMPSRPPRHIAVPVRSAPDQQGSHAT